MNEILESDQVRRPELFVWNAPIPERALREWISARSWVVPNDLLVLWSLTGGGTIFESETIFAPWGDPLPDSCVDSATKRLRSLGLPERYLVFHEGGVGVSAVEQPEGSLVLLTPERSFAREGTFRSLDDWYIAVVRAEYAARYGLQ